MAIKPIVFTISGVGFALAGRQCVTQRLNVLVCIHRYIVLTTSAGIMDHEEARRKHTGGKILGFFF